MKRKRKGSVMQINIIQLAYLLVSKNCVALSSSSYLLLIYIYKVGDRSRG